MHKDHDRLIAAGILSRKNAGQAVPIANSAERIDDCGGEVNSRDESIVSVPYPAKSGLNDVREAGQGSYLALVLKGLGAARSEERFDALPADNAKGFLIHRLGGLLHSDQQALDSETV